MCDLPSTRCCCDGCGFFLLKSCTFRRYPPRGFQALAVRAQVVEGCVGFAVIEVCTSFACV